MKLTRTELLEAPSPLLLEADAANLHFEQVTLVSETFPLELLIDRVGTRTLRHQEMTGGPA